MAENIDVNVNVNTTTGQRNLDSLTKKIDGVQTSFLKLRAVVASISFSAVIGNALQFAQALQQASQASGVALDTVTAFANSVAQLGGNAEKAAGDIVDFVAGLDAARQGSASAQAELAKVGITLTDLSRLSEEDLFKKTVQGLTQIEDASKRNALAVKLLGKSFKDIDIRAVSQGMQGAGGIFDASAIRDAAEAQKRLSAALAQVQSTLLKILQPFAQFINSLDPKVINNFADTLTRVVAVLTVMWGYSKLAGIALTRLAGATQVATGALAGFIGLLAAFAARLISNFTLIGKIISIIALLNTALKALTGIDVFDTIATSIGKAYDAAKQYFGFVNNQQDHNGMGDRTARYSPEDIKRMEDYVNTQADAAKKVIDANRAQKLEADKILAAYKLQNGELQTQLSFQNTLIGKDEDYANRQTKMFEVQQGYISQINQLRTKYLDMQAAAAVGTDEEKAAFASFAAVYTDTVQKVAREYENQNTAVGKLLNTEQVLKAAETDRQNTITAITSQMERQATLGDQIRAAYDKLKDVQFEGAQMKRSPLEKQFAQIQEDARKAAREASLAFSAGFENLDLSAAQAKELADGLEQIAQKYGKIADAQRANLEASRTWEQGWADAFNSYMDNATNAATRAGDAFSSITSNMNSAIDNFVTTGKFKFGDFARSVIQDLIKIELKAQATSLLKAAGGGIGSILGSIFGGFFAEGGSPPVGKASIVGENGPELFVPKSAGTIIPNGGGSAGNAAQGNTYITNNISALDAKSVAQLFAENRKTLFGTVELARKEVSYGVR